MELTQTAPVNSVALPAPRQYVKADASKMDGLLKAHRPEDVKGVRSWLAMAARYQDHISEFYKKTTLLSRMQRKSAKFSWSEEHEAEWKHLKAELAKLPMLHHYDPKNEVWVYTDASQTGIGGVVVMVVGPAHKQREVPLKFWSRRLVEPTEVDYSAIKRELLALYEGCKEFRPYIHGRSFEAFTDHKPLLGVLKDLKSTADTDDKVCRMVSWLNGLKMEIHHIQGVDNVVADWASREIRVAPIGSLALDWWMEVQKLDDFCRKKREALLTGLTVPGFEMICGVLCKLDESNDVEAGRVRMVVPSSAAAKVIAEAHNDLHGSA